MGGIPVGSGRGPRPSHVSAPHAWLLDAAAVPPGHRPPREPRGAKEPRRDGGALGVKDVWPG
eukprot:11180275-Prorocentrum_lima.AAC.1